MPNIHYWGVFRNCWIALLIRADLPCLVPLVLFHNKVHTRSERIKHLMWEHIHTGNLSEFGKQRHKNRWMKVWVLLNWSVQVFFQKLIANFPTVIPFTIISLVAEKTKQNKKTLINSGEKQTTVFCLVLDARMELCRPRLWASSWYSTADCCVFGEGELQILIVVWKQYLLNNVR